MILACTARAYVSNVNMTNQTKAIRLAKECAASRINSKAVGQPAPIERIDPSVGGDNSLATSLLRISFSEKLIFWS